MKKILTVLISIGVFGTIPISTSMTLSNTHILQSEIITSVKSDNDFWRTETGGVNAANGYEKINNKWDIPLSKFAPSFDIIKANFKYIVLDGNFEWGTYLNGKSQNTLKLVEGTNIFENDDQIHFSFDRQHKASNGWGHQQSNITINVDLKKMVDGSSIIHLETWAEAASQASAHKCHTTINISTISFIA